MNNTLANLQSGYKASDEIRNPEAEAEVMQRAQERINSSQTHFRHPNHGQQPYDLKESFARIPLQ